jgi:acyl-coenzyme A thioesterase PaaI-like protein
MSGLGEVVPSSAERAAVDFVTHILKEQVPLAGALGIACAAAQPDGVVRLNMPQARLTTNHVGTAFAGALYVLQELAAGCALALVGQPHLVPVLVRSEEIFRRPARGPVICDASSPITAHELTAAVEADRTHESAIRVECCAEDRVSGEAVFTYRWLRRTT